MRASLAAVAYVQFALRASAAPLWVAVEVAQVLAFGVLATLGWRRSPYWLAAGWALHPFWDFPLHYVGPGHSFTPVVYAISCVSFDWFVAGYIVIAELLKGRAPTRGQAAEAL